MAQTADIEKPSILLIEDDEEIAFILKFILPREGFSVLHAPDGRAASEMINTLAPPKLVLCDIALPYIDGFQLISQIRSKQEWRDVPLIMLTAKSQESNIVRAIEAGANDYIIKPFSPKELVARLRRFLK